MPIFMITNTELEQILELEKTATPGPWGVETTEHTNWIGPLRKDGKVDAKWIHRSRLIFNNDSIINEN